MLICAPWLEGTPRNAQKTYPVFITGSYSHKNFERTPKFFLELEKVVNKNAVTMKFEAGMRLMT